MDGTASVCRKFGLPPTNSRSDNESEQLHAAQYSGLHEQQQSLRSSAHYNANSEFLVSIPVSLHVQSLELTGVAPASCSSSKCDMGRARNDAWGLLSEKDMADLQAILTVLPKQGLMSSKVLRKKDLGNGQLRWSLEKKTHAEMVEAALLRSCLLYPRFAGELRKLVVVAADEDLAIFSDARGRRLFTSLRGTSPFKARDLGDDALVALGYPPTRVECVRRIYRGVRDQFLGYRSYGCGHSLGGSVLHELACSLEQEPAYAFDRIDVFNAGGSPLQPTTSALRRTAFFSHRTEGDLVSLFYKPPGGIDNGSSRVVLHQVDPMSGSVHRMGHFLPRRCSSSPLYEHHNHADASAHAECLIM